MIKIPFKKITFGEHLILLMVDSGFQGPTGSRNPLEVNDSNLWKGLTTWMSQEDSRSLVFEL